MSDDNSPNLGLPRLRSLQNAFFIALLVGVSLVFLWMIGDFLKPVFWAAVLAVLFYPVYGIILSRLKDRKALASLLTILVILVLVILPLTFVAVAVAREGGNLYERISSGEIDIRAPLRTVENAVPMVSEFMGRFGMDLTRIQESISSASVEASRFIASQALDFGQDALRIGAYFFIMLYLLFFFLRDGGGLRDMIIRALPLGRGREERLLGRFAEVTRATMKGTLIVGVAQGSLGGLVFWILGIQAAVFWGVIMTILSLIPALGSGLVWGPAAIIFFAQGDITRGVILVAAGTLLIGLVDNILRPQLVGRDTRMPDYLILLTTLGGLAAFGLSGFVIGPMIAALFLTIWEMFMEEYHQAEETITESGAGDD